MTLDDLELIEQLCVLESRDNFWAFRRYLNPKMKIGWWQKVIADNLQQFYQDFIDGKRPKLIIQAPPQHGKSEIIVDFVAWLAGKNADTKTIYTSFSDDLCTRANLNIQRIYDNPKYHKIFPLTKINTVGVKSAEIGVRNLSLIEHLGAKGYFANTTVQGAITGKTLDIGIIDDPIKGSEAANSRTVRDKIWAWLKTDFMSRFSDQAGLISILTRWHIDDPIGRLIEAMVDDIKIISYPAIAEKDEKHRKAGDALFPQLKSLEFLQERKSLYSAHEWSALYQQNPQVQGGNLIHVKYFGMYKQAPILKYRVIYADTAQKTQEMHDYSVFECWGMGDDGKIYLIDLIRGKWEAPELRRRAKIFWSKHKALDCPKNGTLRQLKIEDKSSGTGLIQELKLIDRLPIFAIQRNKDKYTRYRDVEGYIEAGYVMLPEAESFLSDFISECEAFDGTGKSHDDQIDPMIDAISDMLGANNKLKTWESL
jgi:predicted phage terminase large subunit-like protein